jgi:phosphate starvation-inducible protein PhoH
MAKKKKTNTGASIVSKLHLQLAEIEPITKAQEDFFNNYDSGKCQLLMGYPGTGKTFLSMFKALDELISGGTDLNQIVIVRSAVPTRDIGFLPGDINEKQQVYELPYKKVCSELFGRDDAYEILVKHGVIRFMITSFVRGITLDNCIVIMDEFQNCTSHEADSVLTRLGKKSKAMFCGDFMQTDFTRDKDKDVCKFVKVLESMLNWFVTNEFGVDDIVRSGLVKAYIQAKYLIHKDGF